MSLTAPPSHDLDEGAVAHALAEPVLVLRSQVSRSSGPAARAVDRLTTILDGLVRVSGVDRPCEDEHVPLAELVADAARGIAVEQDCDVTVRGDRALLGTLVTELLENVRVHGGGTARVTATTGPDGAWSLLVEDDGPGLPSDMRPLRRSLDGHAGVGLVICSRIARAHGGRLEARSAARGGTRVVVDVPGRG